MRRFNRPIPGQSLTREPGNAPYERPPEVTDPEKALMMHLERLVDPDKMEAVLLLLDNGAPLSTVTDNILRNAVAAGIHSIDVSLLIKEPIEEWIAGTAKEVGISFRTGYEKDDGKVARERHAMLKALDEVPDDLVSIEPTQSMQLEEQPEPMMAQGEEEVMVEEEEPMMMEEAPSKGLMARV